MRRAFTMIELLVVIAILALLISILAPALRGARVQARRAACASNLRQVGVALRLYLNDHHERWPHASHLPSAGAFPLEGDRPIYLADVLLKKSGMDPAIFHCPQDLSGVTRDPPNTGRSYFESERSSYEYRTMPRIGGRTIEEVASSMERFFQDLLDRGLKIAPNTVWVMRDYDNFHGVPQKPGAREYLYADGHVGDFEN